MRARLVLTLAIITALIGTAVAAVPARNAEATAFVVDSTADATDALPGDGVCDTGAGECSLRAAIQEANALDGADSIEVPAGTYSLAITGAGEPAGTPGIEFDDLDITGDLTIAGAGAEDTIIDGGGLFRVFEIHPAATVQVSAVTIDNGSDAGDGGGIVNRGTLLLASVTVSHNAAGAAGGGVMNFGELTINNSSITGNSASIVSGGISNTSLGTVSISDSTISGNTAVTAAGIGSDGTLTLTDSTVSGNRAFDNSGGLGNRGFMTVINSVISGNTASAGSGGIGSAPFATLEIIGTTISSNTSEVSGGIGNGGAMTISNSAITGNTAVVGGGFTNGINATMVVVTNTTISGNTADTGGGFLNIGAMTLASSTVAGNVAEVGGGLTNGGELTMENTIVADNSDENCFGNGEFISNGHNLDDDDSCGLDAASDLTNVDPHLGPLADNGGATSTHALLPGSPAIDNAGECPPPDTDQRLVIRPQGAACDIGAFELEGGEPKATGDVNDDRRVDSVDALLILQFDAGVLGTLSSPGNADANGDGRVNSIDAALVLQFTAGLLDSLPP